MTDSMHSALEIWREGNAAALEAVGYVIDADLCRRGQFDEMPSAKAFQEIIANALAKPPHDPRTCTARSNDMSMEVRYLRTVNLAEVYAEGTGTNFKEAMGEARAALQEQSK